MMNTLTEELESLLLEWEEGTLDKAGVIRVREILRTDDEARSVFVQQQLLSAALSLESSAGIESRSQNELPSAPIRSRNLPSNKNYWTVSAVLLLVSLLSWRVINLEFTDNHSKFNEVVDQPNSPPSQETEATSQGVALVTKLVDVVWGEGRSTVEVGEALSPGLFRLESGFAQIEFFCGATVVIEGPAELDLKSPLLAHVRSGQLRAQVPPAARGFSLEVDQMTVVDLGTEFGLSVSEDGANVQVFDGEVELKPTTSENRLLKSGEAVLHTRSGQLNPTETTPERFVSISRLESRLQGQQDQRFQRWQAWSEELRDDPRLIVYYSFDQPEDWKRRLRNSTQPANKELDGAIVGADQVTGRWPKKGGLEFKHPGDRVRVQIPGEFGSLTFACWVKIDSLDRWYNSLFLTDGYNQGEPHWQILDSGQIYFSVRPGQRGVPGPLDKKILSPSFWKPSLSGKWIHLATTYDVEARTTTHYLNGEQLHTELIPEAQLVKVTKFGTATLGNWSDPTQLDSKFAIRNLNGSFDEFAIFSAVLTPGEIREMYEIGKPSL